ncbi:unnamed protein product, partial [Didymodactylos carnosus]
IAIVSQEPVLFDLTIRENIAYGDHSRSMEDVTMAEIMDAANKANIHDFIQTLPQGYRTNVGMKGTQLSGGEKQRIAMEIVHYYVIWASGIVQEALERAQFEENRTTIMIAHRLSTIRNCDLICVIGRNGQIIEYGQHNEHFRNFTLNVASAASLIHGPEGEWGIGRDSPGLYMLGIPWGDTMYHDPNVSSPSPSPS